MSSPKLRILCFGASLVAGYSSLGAVYHPFSQKMVNMLSIAMRIPESEIEVTVDGLPGDMVTQKAFTARLEKHFPGGCTPFDWTVILGATNDLAYGYKPDHIFEKLRTIWDTPLSHGSKMLALTVPEAAIDEDHPELVASRNALNELIKGYNRENFHAFDLRASVSYSAMTPAERQRYWDDAIHFTPDGYDLIGEKVGVGLVGIILRQKTARLEHSP